MKKSELQQIIKEEVEENKKSSPMSFKNFLEIKEKRNSLKKESVNKEKITTDKEFANYAKSILEKAFSNSYDDKVANKIIEGILSKSSGNYVKAISILTAGLEK